jgi:hypothetical protein
MACLGHTVFLLAEIAETDGNESVRKAAVKRLSDQAV